MPPKDSLYTLPCVRFLVYIVADIVSSKSYTRNLLVALRFSNSYFYVQNFRFCALFCRFTVNQAEIKKYFPFDVHQPLGLLYSENDVSDISTEKALYQNVEKHYFRHIQPDCWPLKQKSKKMTPSTELSNGIARLRIDLSYVLMINVLPSSV
jgi:hypothetical protein